MCAPVDGLVAPGVQSVNAHDRLGHAHPSRTAATPVCRTRIEVELLQDLAVRTPDPPRTRPTTPRSPDGSPRTTCCPFPPTTWSNSRAPPGAPSRPTPRELHVIRPLRAPERPVRRIATTSSDSGPVFVPVRWLRLGRVGAVLRPGRGGVGGGPGETPASRLGFGRGVGLGAEHQRGEADGTSGPEPELSCHAAKSSIPSRIWHGQNFERPRQPGGKTRRNTRMDG